MCEEITGLKESKPTRSAKELLGKNISNTPSHNSRNPTWFPQNLIEIIKRIIASPKIEMKKPSFIFEMNQEAAQHNWKILEESDLDLGKALENQRGTQLDPGSEFRPTEILEPLLENHPLWPRLNDQLKHGADFPLDDLGIKERKEDVEEALIFGNHKGADDNEELFHEMMLDDVTLGYSIPIPRDKVCMLPEAVISPMNIQDQHGINEKGEIIAKKRLTHNQSMKYKSGTSVNSRTQKDKLQDVMYGSCLLRVIHQIVEYRFRFPDKRILLQKIDFKLAYRRQHLHPRTAIQTITQFVSLALGFIALRLTFGGAPNPNFWGNVSEVITDLANALLQCQDWDPTNIHSPLQKLIPKFSPKKDKRPFTKALPTIVNVNVRNEGQADCYIDDITTVIVESIENIKRAASAVLLAIHTVGRPVDKRDPIKRLDLVSLSKLQAEAALEEQKILLGWKLDTRSLEISLPFEKFTAWTNGIKNIIAKKHTTFDELETLVGRMGHVSVIVSHIKHFLSRIRQLMYRAKHKRSIKITEEVEQDLLFLLKVLQLANKGISLNLITYRKVDRAYRSDACPAGIGGYSTEGRAWRMLIPANLQFRATLNMLEHLASIIGPWIDILEGTLDEFSCILSMTDSTTSAGWLKKSNFKESESESKEMTKAKLKLSRDHATRLMENNIKDYSQWFPGVLNEVADSLSRDHHVSDQKLTNFFLSNLSKQTPTNFQIFPLPQEIESFIFSMLQTLPEATQQQEKHKPSSLFLGEDGANSSTTSNWTKISSYKICRSDSKQSYSQLSHNQSEMETSAEELIENWSVKQSEPPWTTYLRPSESLISQTQGKTKTESLAEFYNNSTRAIKMKTQEKNNRKRCQSVSSEEDSQPHQQKQKKH